MEKTLFALEQLIPDGIQLFRKRYTILQTILENEPVGRRNLTQMTAYSERFIRTEVELLNEQGLICTSSAGMSVSEEGKNLLSILYRWYQHFEGCSQLEKTLEQLLDLKKAIVIKGDVDTKEAVKGDFGNAGTSILSRVLKDDFTIAVTGGTTVSKMVEAMLVQKGDWKNVTIVPARGSIGKRVEFQANTIAVELARKLDVNYELLNIPDNLSEHSIESIKQEPHLQKTLQKIDKSDIIIFGLGNAINMAKRRKESQNVLQLLQEKQAVAEVFRYYFDKQGKVIHRAKNIGLTLDMAMQVPIRIAVAGGKSKAAAILAVRELLKDSYLIIDEGAAEEILKVSIC